MGDNLTSSPVFMHAAWIEFQAEKNNWQEMGK